MHLHISNIQDSSKPWLSTFMVVVHVAALPLHDELIVATQCQLLVPIIQCKGSMHHLRLYLDNIYRKQSHL